MAKPPKQFESAFETYTVETPKGQGGAGTVFVVRDSKGERLALKCLSPTVSSSIKRKRFKNEAHFCLRPVHKNIVRVLDYGTATWDSTVVPFYVMPLMAGTLRDCIESGIPKKEVLPMFGQILDGLDAAHKLGVWHRDIKPENILRNAQNELIVADFGIASFTEEIMVTFVETKPSEKLANFSYAAPEQREKGGTVDGRADIFALGCILNEMFTGRVPHGHDYMSISSVAPEFGYLDDLVATMLKQNPSSRPHSPEDIMKELIARGNEFISLQKLDALRQQVVPESDPGKVQPVFPMAVDWRRGTLTLTLNRAPEQPWIGCFTNPTNLHSWTEGLAPYNFSIHANTASIAVNEQYAQAAIEAFKRFSELATPQLQHKLQVEAEERVKNMRIALLREQREEEKRLKVLSNLKL